MDKEERGGVKRAIGTREKDREKDQEGETERERERVKERRRGKERRRCRDYHIMVPRGRISCATT